MRESNVELIMPPIITIASGDINGLVLNAMGKSPPIAVRDIRMMGRNLTSPPSRIASSTIRPCWRSWLVKSTK